MKFRKGAVQPNASVVGLWHLDGNSLDSSGHGNNGTDTAVTYGIAYGKFGQGASFNGSNSTISLSSSASPTGSNPRTISAWIYYKGTASGYELVYGAGGTGTTHGSFNINIVNDGSNNEQVYLQLWYDDQFTVNFPTGYFNNSWHNIVVTYSGGTTANLCIYVDGVAPAWGSGGHNIVTPSTVSTTNYIGGPTNGYFNGYIDDVSIYPVALSAAEIAQMYVAGMQKHTTGRNFAQRILNAFSTYTQNLSATASSSVSLAKGMLWTKALSVAGTAITSLGKVATHFINLVLGGGSVSSGPNYPTSAVDQLNGDHWTNPTYVEVADSQYADGLSQYTLSGMTGDLYITGFGFLIPPGSTIDGVFMEMYCYQNDTTNGITDAGIYLLKGGIKSGSDMSVYTAWPSTVAIRNYGGSSNLWGTTLTPSDVNASNFGVSINASTLIANTYHAYIDYVRLTVYYTKNGMQGITSLSKNMTAYRTLSLSEVATIYLSNITTFLKTISVSMSGLVYVLQQTTFYKSLSVAVTGLISIATGGITLISMAAQATGVVSIGRFIQKTISVSVSGLVSIGRFFWKGLAATGTGIVLVGKMLERTFVAGATGLVSLAKGFLYSRTLSVAASSSVSLIKTHLKNLSATASGLASMTFGKIHLILLQVQAIGTVSIVQLKTFYRTFLVSPVAKVLLYVNGHLILWAMRIKGTATWTKRTIGSILWTKRTKGSNNWIPRIKP